MKKNLSANAMFHFTKNFENLISILENKFYLRYCMENFEDYMPTGIQKEYAIPMVCFCDIPLSQISNHIKEYGGYAIGLTKDWAERKKINPIMYTIPKSSAVEMIRKILSNIYKLHEEDKDEKSIEEIYKDITEYIAHLKKYEGNKWSGSEFNGDIVRFYDEREWRYIPSIKDVYESQCSKYFMPKSKYLDEELRNKENNKLASNIRLEFEPCDIKYIIVKDDKEVVEVQKNIENIFNNKSYEQVRLLLSRILSMNQILEDF